MKRFHVHIVVDQLVNSIDFYSKLFGQQPSKQREDYAKWMLENPKVNFAISARGHRTGLNHFGIQVDSAEELAEIKQLAENASKKEVVEQSDAACCYAKSDKHWTVDPMGFAWEHFHTMQDAEQFGQDNTTADGACCIPVHGNSEKSENCCVPNEDTATEGGCCG